VLQALDVTGIDGPQVAKRGVSLFDMTCRRGFSATVAESLLDVRSNPRSTKNWQVGGFSEQMSIEMERSSGMGDLKRHSGFCSLSNMTKLVGI
jgi:hypothetical protein